jgi:hypothetical protein
MFGGGLGDLLGAGKMNEAVAQVDLRAAENSIALGRAPV